MLTWRRLVVYVRDELLRPIPVLVFAGLVLFWIAVKQGLLQIGTSSSAKSRVVKANTVPDGRKVPVLTPDTKNITQVPVVPVRDPGVFDDGKVVIQDPKTGKDIKVVVPDGVKDSKVDTVIVVKPEVDTVTVIHDTKVSPARVEDLVRRYKT